MSEHTPGPWHWTTVDTLYGDGEPGGRNLLIAGDGRFVAATKPDDDDIIVGGADARLIAAAPEMLALLREAGKWYCGEVDGKDARELIAALLARVDGKSQAPRG